MDVVSVMEDLLVDETWIVDEEEVVAETVVHQEDRTGFQITLQMHQWPAPVFLWETYPPMTLDSPRSCLKKTSVNLGT